MTQKPNPASVLFWWSRIRWWWYLWHSLVNSRQRVQSSLLPGTWSPTTSHSIDYTLPTVQLLVTQYRLSTIIQFSFAATHHPLSTTHTPLLFNHHALRITHHLLRTAHYPVPTTHYSLAFTYLALLPFPSLLVHSKHSSAAPPVAGAQERIPPLHPAPPSAARPRRERQRQAERQRIFFYFYCFFCVFCFENLIQTWKFQFLKNWPIWSFFWNTFRI